MLFLNLKSKIILLFSLITFLISGLSTLICSRTNIGTIAYLLGIAFMLIALVFHIIASKNKPLLHIVSICSNALAIGFTIGFFYTHYKIFLSILTTALIFILYMLFNFLICFFLPKAKSILTYYVFFTIFLFLGIASIFLWKKTTYANYGFYQLINVISYYLLAKKTLNKPTNILKDISLFSFLMYILQAVCVLLTLCVPFVML